MDADHPKLQAFQDAVKVALEKRLAEGKVRIARLKEEKEAKIKLKMEMTKELHDSQRQLKREEAELMAVTEKVHDLSQARKKQEEVNRGQEAEVRIRQTELREAEKRRNELQERLNRILLLQIRAEARRVDAAGNVGAGNTTLSKTEADFKTAQEMKKAQDMYMERMQETLEELEQRELEYSEQVRHLNTFLRLL